MSALADLVGQLVAIDSVNPTLVPGGAGEAAIAAFVADWLRDRGVAAELWPTAAEGRPNVVAVVPGSGGGRSLLLNGHLDTVGVAGMERPFAPRIEGNRLFGRGAFDMKSGLAIGMLATVEAARLGLRGDVVLTAVADEEHSSVGTEAIARELRADAAIVLEATALQVVTAHRGFAWLEVEVRGRAAHGSRPDLGVDAIARMGRVLAGVEELAARLERGPRHPLLGTGSVHASLIRGGQDLASYPARCTLDVERRTLPGESRQRVEAELTAIVDGLRAADSGFEAAVRCGLVREPMEVDAASPIVGLLVEQASRALGRPVAIEGRPYWTDAALLTGAGTPAVIFGPDGDGAHGEHEWVDLDSAELALRATLATLSAFCG